MRRVTVLIDRIVVDATGDVDRGALRDAVESELRRRLLEPGALDGLRSSSRARHIARRPAGQERPTAADSAAGGTRRLGATIAGATMEVVGR